MPRTEYTYEVREQAEVLFVEDGRTYEEVAQATGVGATTLKNWGKQGRWTDLRRERLETRRNLSRKLENLRVRMMEKAALSEDPQAVYAAVRLEKLALDRERVRRKDAEGASAVQEIDRPRVFLEGLEFTAEYLRAHDPEALKVLARHIEGIVKAFKRSQQGGVD